jgi:hypothetical protein
MKGLVSDIRHYSKKLRRKANEGTTTRCITVDDKYGGIFLANIYEVRPTLVRDGDSIGYHYHAVSRESYSRLEEAISVAEVAFRSFRSALRAGFHEVVETSAGE